MRLFWRNRAKTTEVSALQRAYHEPRASRGLSDRVFLDPNSRRKSRIVCSAITLVTGISVWLLAFAMIVSTNGGLEAALPDRINALKTESGIVTAEVYQDRDFSADPNLASIDLYSSQEAAGYRCLSERKVAHPAVPIQKQKIYAVLPAGLPWATESLSRSCDTVHVVIPTWFHAKMIDDRIEVVGVNQDTRDPLGKYTGNGTTGVKVMPIVGFEPASLKYMNSVDGRRQASNALAAFIAMTERKEQYVGLCIDASQLISYGTSAFTNFVRSFAEGAAEHGLTSCIALSSDSPDSALIIANRFFDTVIVKSYRDPWIGSAPQPLADIRWFEAQIRSIQNHVSLDKLVVELGTHTIDWVSGRPQPETLPFAVAMSVLASNQVLPEYLSTAKSSRAKFIDQAGLQHQMWLLDAASMHNQILALQRLGVSAVGLSGLGYEDPGIWAVLDQTTRGLELADGDLTSVILSDYVEHIGNGPFVAPISMPEAGIRSITTDQDTNEVTFVGYTRIPRPASVRLYGAGEPNKVVLTFDDGPHPLYTAETLNILSSFKAPAAFFVLGHNAVRSPDLIRRILADGHELGSHTYSHPRMGDVSASRATAEVNSVQLLINGISGRTMRLYREPYMRSGGPLSSKEVASLLPLENSGYIIAGMDIVPRDWIAQTAEDLAREIISQVEENAGGIVLLHDGGGDQSQTVAALPIVISELRDRGYEFTTIAEFLGTSQDVLMPESDRIRATFGNLSFLAVGKSWSILKIAFWTVFCIGVFRSIAMLLVAARRKPHLPVDHNDQPSVTIVIPAYNEELVIEKCIRCALSTQYPDYDIIVVDDGSTDETNVRAMSFAYHPLVTIITQSNRGKAAALNAALDEAQSDILICIDADSQISSDAVSFLAAHFNDPAVGAVAGRVVVGNRKNLLTRLQALEYITAQSVERRAKECLNAITVVPGAIGAWRATALMEAGIFSTETLTEDADMTMAMIRSNYQVIYEDQATAFTETPATLDGLMTQRLRWSLGMMQSGWKHLGAIGEGRKLGLVALPDLAIFGYLMPLIAPLADLFLLILIAEFLINLGSGNHTLTGVFSNPLVFAYLALPALEVLTAVIAFRLDPHEDKRLLLLLPLQRIFYRQVLYISVIRAMWRAVTGSLASWGRMTRAGFQIEQAQQT